MARKVLLTVSPIYRQAVDGLCKGLEQAGFETSYLGRPDEQLTPHELLELLRGIEIYVVGNARVPRTVIEQSSELRLISKYGVGVDNVDLKAAAQRAVKVTNAPGANATSVAEMAIGLMIALSRKFKEIEQSLRNGSWRLVPGRELSGRTLGIVGLGNIGKQVAVRARALGMRVLANDIIDYPDFCRQFQVNLVDLSQVLAESDIVTLHVPLTPVTRHMLGEPQFERMKRGSILIDTARGGVVDEAALYRALAVKHLAAAAVDVFEQEPLGQSPLRSLDNVILTPHIAGITCEASERIAKCTLANILAYQHGRTPPNLLDFPSC